MNSDVARLVSAPSAIVPSIVSSHHTLVGHLTHCCFHLFFSPKTFFTQEGIVVHLKNAHFLWPSFSFWRESLSSWPFWDPPSAFVVIILCIIIRHFGPVVISWSEDAEHLPKLISIKGYVTLVLWWFGGGGGGGNLRVVNYIEKIIYLFVYLFIYLFPFYLTKVALSVSSTVLQRDPVNTNKMQAI